MANAAIALFYRPIFRSERSSLWYYSTDDATGNSLNSFQSISHKYIIGEIVETCCKNFTPYFIEILVQKLMWKYTLLQEMDIFCSYILSINNVQYFITFLERALKKYSLKPSGIKEKITISKFWIRLNKIDHDWNTHGISILGLDLLDAGFTRGNKFYEI